MIFDLKNCNVVIGSFSFWNTGSYKVGIHFFTEYFLQKGANVYFLTLTNSTSIPMFLYGLIKHNRFREVIDSYKLVSKQNKEIQLENNNQLITYSFVNTIMPMPLPFFDSYWFAKNYVKFVYPSVQSLKRRLGLKNVDIFMFDIGGMPLYDYLQADLCIYRYQDARVGKVSTRGILEYDEEVLQKADIVLPVSKPIYDYVIENRKTSEGVYYMPNGVNIDIFLKSYPIPQEYLTLPKPIAVFVGVSSLIDWDLCFHLSKSLPDTSFVFIGRMNTLRSKIPSNFYLLGPKKHEDIPSYLQHADVGLIPYIDCEHIRAVEKPLKFYEYIASGLPVVSVSYGAMSSMAPWAMLADNYNEFVECIKRAVKSPLEYKQKLREVAKDFAWDKIFEKLDKIIEHHLSIKSLNSEDRKC
ncbi:TPA: glycosyltransferase [Candidatus Poribacteria bacterium]|nr:glycosyltransferase [Candidatus Poribacteria bacterium]